MSTTISRAGLLLGIVFLLSACRKTEEPAATQVTKYRLSSSRFYYVDGSYYNVKYVYSDAGRLIREEQTRSDGAPMAFKDFQYVDGKLSVMTLRSASAVVAEFRYLYEGDRLAKTEYLELNNKVASVPVFDRTLTYEGDQVVRITTRYRTDSASYYDRFTYAGSNVASVKTYSLIGDKLLHETTLEYDSHLNPFFALTLAEPGNARYSSKNNILKMKTVRSSQTTMDDFRMSYEYNTAGYPTRQFIEFPDGKKHSEQTFEYTTIP
ncbi:hypothetical protein [Larkinella soli]|uniref:hypothetical protein n=1 Tax=Larkinella soli TaxID=1770527 RepID=UPI000FFB7C58|nr:hypothetical protein [Larkinella soli]